MFNLLAFYTGAALLISAANAQLPGPNFKWCNRGTAGTNYCEPQGWHTFCCTGSPASEGEFQYAKEVFAIANNPQGNRNCGEDPNFKGTYLGQVFCA